MTHTPARPFLPSQLHVHCPSRKYLNIYTLGYNEPPRKEEALSSTLGRRTKSEFALRFAVVQRYHLACVPSSASCRCAVMSLGLSETPVLHVQGETGRQV